MEIEAWDGDGGYARLNLTINSINGKPAINNTSPRVSIDAPGTAFEDTEKLLSAAVVDYYNTSRMTNNSYLKYTWDFGDGTNASDYGLESINHVWTNAGTYMVQLTVFDGEFVGVNIITVIVANHIPEVSILGQSEVYEDQFVQYTTKGRCIDTVSDMDSMRFIWTFDDGTIATGETVNHTWASNGTHHVTVKAIDNNCDVGQASFEVIVKELLPDFYEPYGFNSIEGNAAEVQIAFKDNILDELDAQFIYTIDGTPYPASSATRIAYTGTTGDHEGTFKMVGSDHTFNSTKLGIMFTNQPPSVFVASQAYYGPAGESLNITAYGIDVISTIETLTYTWNIAGNIEVLHDTGSWSNIEWTPSGSGDIIGTVEVTDGRFETTSYQFYVKVSLDDDLDEIPNEVDFPANNLDGNEPDSDGDMLTDGYEYNYIGTKPNMSDTDGDKLWDGIDPSTGKGELYYNTDPLNNDTDGDGLLDGDEVTPREIWVLEYGQTEEKSVLVISSPLLMDTDGDGLTDLYEFQNGTNPSDPDTDHDGNSDFMESTLALSVDNDKDRVPDVYEILGFDLHLANNTVYKVFSDPTKNDTDMDGLTDWEEWNFGADGYKTDPSKNDTDGDGLLDSQEVYSKGQEYGQRIKLTANVEAHFYFRAYFAPNLMNVSVTIGASVGEDGDAARFTYRVTFGGTTVVENNTATGNGERYFFNATDVTEETNGRADGYWHLYIKPHGRDALLEIFKIEGVARLNPVKMDTDGDGINDYDENFGTNGYMTDPSRKDTDADGWDDSKEIFETLTNPLDSDSDGDGVIDNVDNAPLGNLILEVKVIKGYWADTPYDDVNGKDGLDMQVVTKVGERTAPTPKYSASDDATTRRLWIFSWNAFCGTWFTSGGRECKYYYDIPDEQDQVLVQMQYWHIWWGWADVGDKILDASRWYDVDPSGAINPDFKIWAGSSWVQYEIRTIQLNKTNTIAVFKDDSTFANKHYSTIGQQNLIMLNVSGSNDYFVDGLNTVVVPSEIFVDTTLHAEIEKSMGSDGKIDTSLLPSGLLAAKFQGIDRTEGTVSRHIESVITVEDEITIGAAQAILDDLLELANDINVPDFFKVARVNPCNISLASDVIDFLPWDGAIMDSESDTGLAPKTLGDAIIGAFIGFGLLIYGGIVAIVGFLLIIWYFIVQIGLFFVGIFQDAIEAVEKAVKAIILVLLYLLFAINLLMIITFFMVFLISFYIFAAASEGAEAHDGLAQGELWVTLKVDGKVTLLELLIQSIMVPWLEVKVPDIHVELTIAGVTLLYAWLGIGALIETGTLPVSNAPTPAPMPPSRSQTRSLQMLESSNSSEKPIASSKSLATPLSGISSNGYTLTESAPSFERNLDIDGNGNEEECYVSAEGYSTAETLSYYYTNNRASATLEKLNELTFNVMLSDTTNFKSGWLVFDECGTNEITEVTFPASSGVQEGDGFIITRQNGQKYYVWLNKGSGTSPTYTSPDVGVEVFISPSATAAGVASAVATALMAISTFADGTGEIAIFNYADGTLKFTQKVIGDTRDVALIGTSVSRIVTRQGSVQAGECEETILGFNSFSGSTQGDHVLFESQDGLVFSIWLDKGDGGSTPSGPVHTKVSTIPIAVSITSSDTAINVASNVVSALRLNELFSDRVTIVDNLDGTIKLTQNSIGKTIDARSENEAEDSEYPPGTIQVTISNNGEMNGMISLGTPSSNVYKPEINLAEIGKISQDDYSNDHQDLMYRYRFVLNDGISFVDFTPSIRRIRIFQNAPPYIFAPRHVDSLSTPPEFRDYKQKFKAFLMDLEGDNPSTGDVFEIKIYDNLLGDSSYDKPFPFAISPDEVENDFVNGVLYEAEAELPFGQSYYSIYYKQNTHLPVIEILDPVGGVLRYQFSHIVLYDLANFNFGLDLTLGCAGAFLIFLCLLKECIDKPSIPWWVGLIALVCTFVALFLPLILSLIIGIGALNDGHYDESNDPRSPASLFFGVAIGYWILFFCMLYAAYLKRAENISNVWAPLAGLLEVVFGIASDTLAGGSDAAQTWELILGGGGIFLLGISLFTIDMNGEYSAGQSIARFLAKLTFVLALVATGLFVTSALIQFYNPV
nr:PKD domain-containing protein [Candidatus Sigynarchaeota archaeon]